MKNLFLMLIAFSIFNTDCKAQSIPNSGFENWTNMGAYFEPDDWSTLNGLTAPSSVYTVTRGTPGMFGNYYIKLTSLNSGTAGVVPGLAVCGSIIAPLMQPNYSSGGFPFTQRPAALTGYWRHLLFGNSQGHIQILMTRWNGNQRVVVAAVTRGLVSYNMTWSYFNISMLYQDGGYPDTCMIVLSASGGQPANGDYLHIDNLSFTGAVLSTDEQYETAGLQLFPNPVNDKFILRNLDGRGDIKDLKITDLSGRIIREIPLVTITSDIPIEGIGLPAGNYFLSGRKGEKVFMLKFSKE